MLARHFKNHSPTPQKCVRVKFPMFANGRNAQLIPLEIVPAMPQIPSASYSVPQNTGHYWQLSKTSLHS